MSSALHADERARSSAGTVHIVRDVFDPPTNAGWTYCGLVVEARHRATAPRARLCRSCVRNRDARSPVGVPLASDDSGGDGES